MNRTRVLYEGALVGLAGAAARCRCGSSLYDLAAGAPFRTPALLRDALRRLRDAAALKITPTLVLEYTVVHGLAFLVFGWAAAGLFALADRDRHVLFGVFMLFCCFEVAALAAVEVMASWLFDTLRPWSIIGANFVAVLVMMGSLVRSHKVSLEEALTSAE